MAEVAAPTVDEILNLREQAKTYWHEPHMRWDTLVDVYHGNYHLLWPEEFRRGEIPKTANWIKKAWDTYSRMVGKVPVSNINPSRIHRVSQAKAEKIEKILAGYDESSGMSIVMKRYAWHVAGLGAGVMGVMPDPTLKGPRFFWKDPRAVLAAPGVGSTSTTPAELGFLTRPVMSNFSLNWVMFDEVVTATYLLDMYPKRRDALIAAGCDPRDIITPHNMITYMDKNWWVVVVGNKKIIQFEMALDFVPVRMTTMFTPDQLGGQSMFEQNIGLVLAYMRLMNQKLTYNDNIVWPWLVLKGMSADEDRENRIIRIMDERGDAGFLNPPGEIQAERDLEMLDRLIRIMNEDTESLRGEAPGANVTAKGLDTLNRPVTGVVQDFWQEMTPDIEFLRSAALMMDEELYGGNKKYISGRVRGEGFDMEYVPKKDINGNHSVKIDFGIGVGGFDGFVELMQLAAQGFVDEQTVMENSPFVKSVSETRKRVFLDRVEKIMFEMLSSMGPGAAPVVTFLSEWRAAVQKNKDPWDWLQENPPPDPAAMMAEGAGAAPPGVPPEGGELGPSGAPGAPPGGGGGAPSGPPAIPSAPSPSQILALAQGRR